MAKIKKPNFGRNKNFWLGIAGCLFILLLVMGSTLWKQAGVGEQTVTAEFEQAAGTRAGYKVKVAGIDVGSVKSVKLAGNHVDIELSIDNDVKLTEDAVAEIKTSTILGAQYIDLNPGSQDLPEIGDRIPQYMPDGATPRNKVPFSLSKVVDDPDPRYENQFDRIEEIDSVQLAKALDTLNAQFSDPSQCPEEQSAPGEPAVCAKLIAQSLDSVGVLAGVIAERKDQFDTLLKNLDEVAGVLDDNRNGVMVVITQGQQIAERVLERQDLIRQLLDNVATLSSQLDAMGADNAGQLGPLIQSLNTMSEGLEKNRDQLNRLLEIFPVTARQLNNAFGSGPYAEINAGWLFPDNWLCFAHIIDEGCVG